MVYKVSNENTIINYNDSKYLLLTAATKIENGKKGNHSYLSNYHNKKDANIFSNTKTNK